MIPSPILASSRRKIDKVDKALSTFYNKTQREFARVENIPVLKRGFVG